MPKYEQYREAWHLLKSPLLPKPGRNGAPQTLEYDEAVSEQQEIPTGPAVTRMQAAMNSFRQYLEKGGRVPR